MKKFFVIWVSQAASLLASSIVGFTLAWYLTQKTGSATILSTSIMMNLIPAVVLGPFIGPYIDRWSRKKIMIFSDIAQSLLSLVLVVLFYTNTIQIWHIYIVMGGYSIGRAFDGPALRASIPMIVPEKHLVRANGLNMTLFGVINIIGPSAGALLMKAFPIQWILTVDAISTFIFLGCILPLAIPQPPHPVSMVKPGYFSDLKQSFRYILSWRGMSYLVVMAALINFLAWPINALLPLFVTKYFGGDVLKLGWLQTVFGVGIIAGGLIMGTWGGFKRRVVTSFTSFLVWSAAIVIFGFMTERLFYAALALMLILGLFNTLGNAPFGAIFQSVVAKDMQGRFHSLYGSLIGMMAPLGLAVAGPVSNAIGLRAI